MVADALATLAALVLGYLLGSLNTGVIVGRIHGTDIRNHGSRSAGLTNTLRVLGKPAAAIVLAGDALKGIVACLVGLRLGVQVGSGVAVDSVGLLAAGAGAIIGHNWLVYFGFKGGKGALTAIVVLFMIDWVLALLCLGFFVTVVASTRYVSLGTLGAALLFVALSFVPAFDKTFCFPVFACLMAATIVFRHRANIQRLLAGTENKLTFSSG
ncbi:MAG: glycerol-3-phosphate 1-O-acyltransferase PlsY [Alphaproteobacteria bacterium]|nr:glycerol-3-phosphate 1-O-acyltransferase PlsY [Alphaproteobacteria bacterium]